MQNKCQGCPRYWDPGEEQPAAGTGWGLRRETAARLLKATSSLIPYFIQLKGAGAE